MGWTEIIGGIIQVIVLAFQQIIEMQKEKKEEINEVQKNLLDAIKARDVARFTYWRSRAIGLRS